MGKQHGSESARFGRIAGRCLRALAGRGGIDEHKDYAKRIAEFFTSTVPVFDELGAVVLLNSYAPGLFSLGISAVPGYAGHECQSVFTPQIQIGMIVAKGGAL